MGLFRIYKDAESPFYQYSDDHYESILQWYRTGEYSTVVKELLKTCWENRLGYNAIASLKLHPLCMFVEKMMAIILKNVFSHQNLLFIQRFQKNKLQKIRSLIYTNYFSSYWFLDWTYNNRTM